MGLFSFVQDAGRRIGLLSEEAPAQAAPAAPDTAAAFANKLTGLITELGLDVENLQVTYTPFTATLRGRANTTADKEKIVLSIGNTMGVAAVDDQLTVAHPAPPAVYHSVVAGDSLSKISLAQYGVLRLYDAIFEANRPMIQHEDEIFPGQVLRIPPMEAPTHTVASGETLGAIAKWWYGDAKKYTTIFEANRATLHSADAIEVGQVLTIPLTTPA